MDQQAEALLRLFWSAYKADDQETTETARTALYNHLVSHILETYRNTGKDASQIVFYDPKVLEASKVKTRADLAVIDRIAKGHAYLAKLYQDDPIDRHEKAIKALDLLDHLDNWLNRPQSMLDSGDGYLKIRHIPNP